MSIENKPVVSLFSGCGGLDLGFKQQGFHPVVAIDNNEAAVASYNLNDGRNIAYQFDLSQICADDIIALVEQVAPNTRPVGVIGGPPCQSFSRSNVFDKPDDPKHLLPLRYATLLRDLNKAYQLDFFVFENVVGLKSNKHRERYGDIMDALASAGFRVFDEVLDACWFGVPQYRKRLFVVGINRDFYPEVEFRFPSGDPSDLRTLRHVLEGLPEPAFCQHHLLTDDIPHHPNHWTMKPRSRKFNASNGQAIAQKVQGRSFRVLHWDRPSWTVAYGNREIHVHPNGNRRLSIFEAMRLQGFPNGFQLLGNFTQQVNQVSDAVPPPLAKALAQAVDQHIFCLRDQIQSQLLTWFGHNKRSFPWRNTGDPYRVLIAEKLLQQTSAREAVINAYNIITSRYPTLDALAQAGPEELKPVFEELGFTYRAGELPRLAQTIVERHGSTIPSNLKELLYLPGVGDYIARAILCFGFGQAVPIMDTNVARLLFRLFELTGDFPKNPARSRRLLSLAYKLLPTDNAQDFNLAILDFCARVCTAKSPACPDCPLLHVCHFGIARISSLDALTC